MTNKHYDENVGAALLTMYRWIESDHNNITEMFEELQRMFEDLVEAMRARGEDSPYVKVLAAIGETMGKQGTKYQQAKLERGGER